MIAETLLGGLPEWKGCYFDGAASLTSKKVTVRKIEFSGAMWVGKNRKQWTEPLRATVTDKTRTKQGVWIGLRVGKTFAESELWAALDAREPTELKHLS